MKKCSYGLGTKATPGNVDMGNSTVPISSLGNVRKCEKMWDPYVNKPKNQWKAHRVDSRRSLPLVKSIWALQWCHFRVLKNARNVRILCKQAQKSMKGSLYGLQTKPTSSKVDMGSSFLESVRNVRTLCKQTQKSETGHQILMIFCQMLDSIALNDLALVLCTKNF